MDEKILELLAKQSQVAEQQAQLLSRLAGSHQKSAYSATAPSYTELHGNGSLWGFAPLERDVISTHLRPKGLATTLPFLPSVTEQPQFAFLTGISDDEGEEPANPCDPAPSGYIKSCTTSAQFGRLTRDTRDIEINKVMLRKNRGDFTDLTLHGRVLGLTGLEPGGLNENQILNIVTMSEMVQVGVRLERKLARQIWQGDVANNNAGGGYKEFPGLDLQVATGHVDWGTNTTCPAVDSDVKNFGYDAVGGTGRDIVEYVASMEFYLNHIASRSGLDPVNWVVVMRPELWFELSAVWPCSYLSHRCNTNAGTNPIVINDATNVSMRDDMRNGMYLDINGRRYPVITDDGIFEHTNVTNGNLALGEYASSIYFLPMSITGGFPVLYREFVDYRAAASDMALLRGNESFWTDGGVYMWVYEQNRFCYRLGSKTEQRVILRTPQLAGRIDAIKYTPLQHLRSPFPDDPYFRNGGVSVRPDSTGFAVWN